MKLFISKTLIVALACGLTATVYAEQHAHSKHEKAHNTKLTLDNGKKWASDLPLRQSMSAIYKLMNVNISLIHSNKMSDDSFKALGKKINAQTTNIFKNCKLTPKADHVLHQILIPILKAEKAFLGTDKTISKHDAAVLVMGSLKNYGKYFEHKDWGMNEKK